jgi:hypothetical protein
VRILFGWPSDCISAIVRLAVLCLFPLLVLPPRLAGYSVLTHEAIIDSAWDRDLKPLLLARFPAATAEQLQTAHAYAYGGCAVQDMGYYPFGSKFFSDLVHYVRSGDFVVSLLRNAADLNEYAFALGALAHYSADNLGHSMAVNRSVPIEYPKLKLKFGDVVTYSDSVSAHIKVEFGFDVLQVARGAYAPESYHGFIGFQVAKPVLERAFHETYSLEFGDVFGSVDLAVSTYRHTVAGIIPLMTKAAWDLKKDDLIRATPSLTRQRFLFNLSRASYRKEWHDEYRKPGIAARLLAFLFRIVPKVGPLRALAFKPPTAATEKLFQESFNKTLEVYRDLLAQHGRGRLTLVNRDFDTGEVTRAGEYKLADETYAKLAEKLAGADAPADPRIRADVLAFFSAVNGPIPGDRNPKAWSRTVAALEKLRHGPSGPR